jgi:hypothetical protein
VQLKIKRSQKDAGLLNKSVIFCLDARAELSPEEANDVRRYKIGHQVIYSSAAARKHTEAGDNAIDGTIKGNFKAIGAFALARLSLNITIASIQKGHHIECKDLEEVVAAEQALKDACQNLKGFLLTAASYDGSESVVDYDQLALSDG